MPRLYIQPSRDQKAMENVRIHTWKIGDASSILRKKRLDFRINSQVKSDTASGADFGKKIARVHACKI